MYRNYTQGDTEIWMIHKIVQSGSIKQALLGTIVLIAIALTTLGIHYGRLSIICAIIGIGLYKRSPGGFIFDLKFSGAKMIGTIIGFRKGVYAGYKISKVIEEEK